MTDKAPAAAHHTSPARAHNAGPRPEGPPPPPHPGFGGLARHDPLRWWATPSDHRHPHRGRQQRPAHHPPSTTAAPPPSPRTSLFTPFHMPPPPPPPPPAPHAQGPAPAHTPSRAHAYTQDDGIFRPPALRRGLVAVDSPLGLGTGQSGCSASWWAGKEAHTRGPAPA